MSKLLDNGIVCGTLSWLKTNKSMKNDLKLRLENYIENNLDKGIWKDYLEISDATNINVRDVIEIMDNSNGFIVNTKRKWTTKDLYKKHTSILNKILDAFANKYR